MEYKRFGNKILVRVDKGEDIVTALKALAAKENVKVASVSGLGAVNDVTVGLFVTGEKTYRSNRFTGDMEIVSLTGSVTSMKGAPYLHLHMSVADHDGTVVGGHLDRAVVSATCENARRRGRERGQGVRRGHRAEPDPILSGKRTLPAPAAYYGYGRVMQKEGRCRRYS